GITESLPLGLIGGLVGALLAIWGIDLLSSLLPASLPRGNAITVNGRVLIFTFALVLLTILICGLSPALQPAGGSVRELLSHGRYDSAARRGRWLGKILTHRGARCAGVA